MKDIRDKIKHLKGLENDLADISVDENLPNTKKEELITTVKENIFLLTVELFNLTKNENCFWEYCDFNTYNNFYIIRMNDFINDDNPLHNSEEDFIISELNLLKNQLKNFKEYYSNELKKPIIKKIKYLEHKQIAINNIEDESIDFSDSKANEKIVFLHKLGVLDFLKEKSPFNTSNNSLATILSAITGENTTTIQPYLNPIYSKNVDQLKNPLQNDKLVFKVNKKLLDIGFIE